MDKQLKLILAFAHDLHGLKTLLRFRGMPGWENAHWERWDSVAEHSYRMALLAVLISPHLKSALNLEKTLKMILIHDIVELVTNDFSPMEEHGGAGGHAFSKQAFANKYDREMAASKMIFKKLPPKQSKEFQLLFKEYINTKAYPTKATPEGKFAYALDKIEATIQIVDWRKTKNDWPQDHFKKSISYLFEWASYDPALKLFCKMIKKEGAEIISKKT